MPNINSSAPFMLTVNPYAPDQPELGQDAAIHFVAV